jgi:putative DNA methylase
LVPKELELIVAAHRFNRDKSKAEAHFLSGVKRAFRMMCEYGHHSFPTTIFYAFKQSEDEAKDKEEIARVSTGWEVMLEGLLNAGFQISGTWPIRTELITSLKASVNALASSIVLVCRPHPLDAPVATRREFIAALKRELPPALKQLQQGAIAPVDLAQAAIGPGMAVFSRFSQVLEADGSPMRVRIALALINQALDEFLAEQEGEFDSDTRWALAWFEQFSHGEGPYGDAETLSKAKNTSVDGLVRAGVLEARAGKVRLLRRDELTPLSHFGRGAGGVGPGARLPSPPVGEGPGVRGNVWASTQYLIRALDQSGEGAAADLLRRLGDVGQTARDLAYRLYAICERKGWAQEARVYNMLAAVWPRLAELAGRAEAKPVELL